ncbi:MAG: tRNA pseudouridine(38-40) synthase TruA [Nitrospiria bacterium]
MTNVKLTLAYDGTPFHGWQIQPKVVTVQEILKKAIETITNGRKVNLIGAGRTDSGVHALGQVANFKTEKLLDEKKWKDALNALLPNEVVVINVELVSSKFHARYSAKKKSYVYRIGFKRSPFLFNKEWKISYPLNVAAMKKALTFLIGKHDFSSFASSLSESESKICKLLKGEIIKDKESIVIRLTADRFLTHMARAIVGTLVEVGSGKIKPKDLNGILLSKNRSKAGKTAPPHGLYLEGVTYPTTFL